MSRAYEALLVNSIQRLDRWMADTESLIPKSDDPITLQQIEFDLSRWRASRDRLATLLARTKWLNRIASWSLALLLVSFGSLFAIAYFLFPGTGLIAFLLAADLLIVLSCCIGYLITIMLRDAIVRGRQPWRFSTRDLLIIMTVLALMIGSLAWFARR
jgi:hypothetical protein